MKKGGCLLYIFLLTCLSLEQSPTPLDYENICKHHFSQGCPVHDGDSWRCAKLLTNCSGDQLNRYHCILNSTDEPFQVIHRCAPLSYCDKGTIPIYDKRKDVIYCKPCRDGYYQPYDTWSDEVPECSKKHTCEKEGYKIECNTDIELHNTQDVYCRCDARKNYILTNFEIRGKCVPWEYATCYNHPCPDGQERLLNYSCASLCPQDQKRDDNDICVPIGFVNQTTTYNDNNRTVSVTGKRAPKTTITTTPTSTYEQSNRDSNIESIIASAVIVPVVLLILIFLLIVCWKNKLYTKCRSVTSSGRNRRQLCTDAHDQTELKVIIHDAYPNGAAQRDTHQREQTNEDAYPNGAAQRDTHQREQTNEDAYPNGAAQRDTHQREQTNEDAYPNGAAQRDTHQREQTNEGRCPVVHHHHHKPKIYNVKADIVQLGDNSQITSFKVPTEQPKTSDDISSSSSRHSNGSQLADSLPPHNSSQGDISVDRDVSLLRNSLEDIESENTQPKRISDGTDSKERHACSEETYRKVVV